MISFCHIVLGFKTSNAFLSIESWIIFRTLGAKLGGKIIYLPIGTLFAEFGLKIKIIRKVARNTCIIIPVIIVIALAFL